MDKFRLLPAMLVISIAGNVFLATKLYFPQVLYNAQIALVAPPQLFPTDRIRGSENSNTTIIVYTNYQCPYCAILNDHLISLISELDFKFAYRHLASSQNEPIAFRFAQAVECAGDQDQFWQFSDALFSFMESTKDNLLHDIAQSIDLNLQEFDTCLATEKHVKTLEQMQDDASSKMIAGTPTFFINDERYIGLRSVEELKQLLTAELINY